MKARCSADELPMTLTEKDTEQLAEESERLLLSRISWVKSLCLSKCICRKSRSIRLKERAVERFESQLDIRSIVKARVDLSILVRSILNKEQLLLF